MKLYKNLKTAIDERDEVEALKLTLKDSFPPELFYFTNLKELYLEGDITDFPKIAASAWPSLQLLSIKWPKFSGDLSKLFSLKSLENLKIISTPMKSFLLPLGHAAAPLKSLTIKDSKLSSLPEEISMLVWLQEMNLSGNELMALPHSFPSLKFLKRLNLDQNKFENFPESFRYMPNLSHLSIDGNKFSEEEKSRIQREFNIWL